MKLYAVKVGCHQRCDSRHENEMRLTSCLYQIKKSGFAFSISPQNHRNASKQLLYFPSSACSSIAQAMNSSKVASVAPTARSCISRVLNLCSYQMQNTALKMNPANGHGDFFLYTYSAWHAGCSPLWFLDWGKQHWKQ